MGQMNRIQTPKKRKCGNRWNFDTNFRLLVYSVGVQTNSTFTRARLELEHWAVRLKDLQKLRLKWLTENADMSPSATLSQKKVSFTSFSLVFLCT